MSSPDWDLLQIHPCVHSYERVSTCMQDAFAYSNLQHADTRVLFECTLVPLCRAAWWDYAKGCLAFSGPHWQPRKGSPDAQPPAICLLNDMHACYATGTSMHAPVNYEQARQNAPKNKGSGYNEQHWWSSGHLVTGLPSNSAHLQCLSTVNLHITWFILFLFITDFFKCLFDHTHSLIYTSWSWQ